MQKKLKKWKKKQKTNCKIYQNTLELLGCFWSSVMTIKWFHPFVDSALGGEPTKKSRRKNNLRESPTNPEIRRKFPKVAAPGPETLAPEALLSGCGHV